MTVELVQADVLKQLEEKTVKGKRTIGGTGGAMKHLELVVLEGLKNNLEATKLHGVLKVTGEDVGSKGAGVTGIQYGINKVLVTFGRVTGLGYRADAITKEKAKEIFGDERAMLIKFYGNFDEHMYATKEHQKSLGIETAYEEPSPKQMVRIPNWIFSSGVMRLPLLLTAGTEPQVKVVDAEIVEDTNPQKVGFRYIKHEV